MSLDLTIFLTMIFVAFASELVLFRFFGRSGLHAWYVISLVLVNAFALKLIMLFGITVGAPVIYCCTFLATDIINEFWGPKEAQKLVWEGFIVSIASVIWIQLFLLYKSHPESAWSDEAYMTIFGFYPRVVVASMIAYIISQTHDVWAYNYWRKIKPGDKYLWIRNNASTMMSQLFDCTIFHAIAFLGVFPTNVIFSMALTGYILKTCFAAMDTPFIYLAKYWWKKGLVPDKKETPLLQKSKVS